jgi:hypothetical protein
MKNNMSSLLPAFISKYLLPYGMAIVLVSRFTALFENTRPPSNVVVAPNVLAALAPGMMVPRNVLPLPIEAAPVGTQNILVLVAFAVPPNATVILFDEVKSPVERKMYTPGVLKVSVEPTDIAPVTQCTPGASPTTMAKSVAAP